MEHTFIRNTLRWQRFLQQQTHLVFNKPTPLYEGKLTGLFDSPTQAATELFQQNQRTDENGIVVNGILDCATRDQAAAMGFDMEFEQGPDRPDDLRECRPYFLVPLLEVSDSDGRTIPRAPRPDAPPDKDALPDDFHDICNRIRNVTAGKQSNPEDDPEITDVYVFSHGWHRNFFSGVQAYDRLASYIALLRHRNRLDLPDKYRPLYLMLHWNSDPGADRWVDKAGRRRKASFMQNVNTVFQCAAQQNAGAAAKTYTDLTNDFEDIFEVFSRVSAPDTYNLSDAAIDGEVLTLTACLQGYSLKFSADAPVEEKVAIAWTCYHEAETVGVQLNQDEAPHQFISIRQAFATFVRFTGSALIAAGLLGAVLSAIFSLSSAAWKANAPLLYQLVNGLQPAINWVRQHPRVALALLFPACWIYLALRRFAWRQIKAAKAAAAKSLPLPAVLAWAYMQVVMTIGPALILTITYFFGRTFAWLSKLATGRVGKRDDGAVPGLFDERFGPRNGLDTTHHPLYFRQILAWLVETPLRLLRDGTPPDSVVETVTELALAQTAFFTMQSKARDAGRDAAKFVATLMDRVPHLQTARVHFIGHSFGGLVVANAARHLALDDRFRRAFSGGNPSRKIQTICLVEGALASNWFKRESRLHDFVAGSIACLYSRYDTANGFFYPIANGGRLSAGYVGMTEIGGDKEKKGVAPEHFMRFISLPKPPNLDAAQFVPEGESVKSRRVSEVPRVLNIDASRLIFRGSALLGGGHDDIFKDDIVNLIWSVTKLGVKTQRPAPPLNPAPIIAAPVPPIVPPVVTMVVHAIQPLVPPRPRPLLRPPLPPRPFSARTAPPKPRPTPPRKTKRRNEKRRPSCYNRGQSTPSSRGGASPRFAPQNGAAYYSHAASPGIGRGGWG